MIGVHQRQGIQKTERGMSQNQGLGEGMQPATQRLQLVFYHERPGALLDQADGLLESRSRQRMGDRRGVELLLLVPATGALMEIRDQRRGADAPAESRGRDEWTRC